MDELNALMCEFAGLKETVTFCEMKIKELEKEKDKAEERLAEVMHKYRIEKIRRYTH